MLRRVLLTGAALALLTAPAVASAARFYIGGHGGYSFVVHEDDFDDDVIYGGAIGVDFGLPALEVTLDHSSYDAVVPAQAENLLGIGAELDLVTLAAALRLNLDLGPLRPYVLLGGAVHFFDAEIRVGGRATACDECDGAEPGLVAGGGLELVLGEHLTIGPDIRYNLIFTDEFVDQAEEDVDAAEFPDYLSVMGRINLYF